MIVLFLIVKKKGLSLSQCRFTLNLFLSLFLPLSALLQKLRMEALFGSTH